jgi:hypothetical protein
MVLLALLQDLMGGSRGGLGDKGTTNGTAWGATMTEEDAQQQQQAQQQDKGATDSTEAGEETGAREDL